jgi:hypothetical protein
MGSIQEGGIQHTIAPAASVARSALYQIMLNTLMMSNFLLAHPSATMPLQTTTACTPMDHHSGSTSILHARTVIPLHQSSKDLS